MNRCIRIEESVIFIIRVEHSNLCARLSAGYGRAIVNDVDRRIVTIFKDDSHIDKIFVGTDDGRPAERIVERSREIFVIEVLVVFINDSYNPITGCVARSGSSCLDDFKSPTVRSTCI